jgi:hypothetical protein
MRSTLLHDIPIVLSRRFIFAIAQGDGSSVSFPPISFYIFEIRRQLATGPRFDCVVGTIWILGSAGTSLLQIVVEIVVEIGTINHVNIPSSTILTVSLVGG